MTSRKFLAVTAMVVSMTVYGVASGQGRPGSGVGVTRPVPGVRPSIPFVRVKAQPAMADFPGFGRRAGIRVTSPPSALSPDKRSSMLKESGIDVRPGSAPREFRLSPREPYVSSSAYLFFKGDTEFNASGDSLLIDIQLRVRLPGPFFGLGESGWVSGGPQPDPPGFVGVLIRMDPRSRYLADFSVSSSIANTYNMTVSGADGTGTFSREAGGQHVLVGLESAEGGYVRINVSAHTSFTFHSVAITKLD